MIRECAPRGRDFTQRHYRYKDQIVDEVAWAKNRTKSKVRARVAHMFQVMKLQFGLMKFRYRGMQKNAHRLFVTSALANRSVSRKKLLRAAVANWAPFRSSRPRPSWVPSSPIYSSETGGSHLRSHEPQMGDESGEAAAQAE